MAVKRREFCKLAGLSALALTGGAGTAAEAEEGGTLLAEPLVGKRWAMVVDLEACRKEQGCRDCIVACHETHNVPHLDDPKEEVKWIWKERFAEAFPDQQHDYLPHDLQHEEVLVFCNHCDSPPCTRVCPTQATWKREDGIVMMDWHRCIGCRYCMAACPYGARSFNWQNPAPWVERGADGMPLSDYPTRTAGVVEKCTFCAERIRVGQLPACVEAVNAVPGGEGALTFGDLSEPDSDVRRLLNDANTIVRREALGTGPNIYYIVPAVFPAAADGRA